MYQETSKPRTLAESKMIQTLEYLFSIRMGGQEMNNRENIRKEWFDEKYSFLQGIMGPQK